jgi:RNA polymerase-binding transcription factor DksA
MFSSLPSLAVPSVIASVSAILAALTVVAGISGALIIRKFGSGCVLMAAISLPVSVAFAIFCESNNITADALLLHTKIAGRQKRRSGDDQAHGFSARSSRNTRSISRSKTLCQSVWIGNQQRQLLRAIDSALGRIRDGTYGKCLSCGKQIDGRRLAAVPWTPYCIQCEEDFER